ncbi:putative pre-16S rRNA nuclease [Alicyclobacillus contaminans]|uniref:Holliday junction resolvase RuvX n=1 Tax=Alicyclobacillus contaminans TaxID=392016 RepID=UPI000412BA71|nr:Holliday junction resolvase RuvX [Alicyclobacillus contaminans]GMA52111.1 putative pre-16S rRNA nuclease [Alicyclobacillus contaminans]
MRILGIDYGRARIGLALSDPTGLVAQPLTVLHRESDEAAAERIAALAEQHEVERVVVGWPRNMNGSVGERAKQCQAFAALVEAKTGIPVDLYDERLTTVAAERMLVAANLRREKRRTVVDGVAAAMMLQGYLDGFRRRDSH